MVQSTRRKFITQTAMAVASLPFASTFAAPPAVNKKLCFSTLGCPDWTFEQIIKFAVDYKYQGIEIRTIQREIDITKIREFADANIKSTKKILADNKIKLVDLGSSAAMHHTEKVARQKNIDDAKRYIDLAEKLDCPYIRVFPNNLPKDDSRQAVLDLIVSGLNELGAYAKNSNVTVLMESHGDLVSKADLVYVMEKVDTKKIGLIWDIMNAWAVTKESPAEVYPAINRYIHHVHVKDGLIRDGKVQYRILGRGEAPIREAIQSLQKGGYKGYYSFEWEKLWHPEIEEPEIALAAYPAEVLKYF
ncbi:MAG: sugar phosphate isomerase/epimerase [Chitinophagaceae bacterium]|nr:MAG: sugar phosphate isomerase/epimerase [Chitinophagaceae bacterium]